MRDLYFDALLRQPVDAAVTYLSKLAHVMWQQGPFILLAGVIWALAKKLQRNRDQLRVALLVVTPALVLGLIPPVLVMPMRYYLVESTAGLALFSLVAVAWLVSAGLHRTMTAAQPRPNPPPGRD